MSDSEIFRRAVSRARRTGHDLVLIGIEGELWLVPGSRAGQDYALTTGASALGPVRMSGFPDLADLLMQGLSFEYQETTPAADPSARSV